MTATRSGLLIWADAITTVELTHDREVHALIGDTFSSCFKTPGDGGGRRLVGYCDDRFLDKPRDTLPWNCYLDPLTLYAGGWPIAGPIVVVAEMGPDSVSMTQRERLAFALGPTVCPEFDGAPLRLPLLRFWPQYRR